MSSKTDTTVLCPCGKPTRESVLVNADDDESTPNKGRVMEGTLRLTATLRTGNRGLNKQGAYPPPVESTASVRYCPACSVAILDLLYGHGLPTLVRRPTALEKEKAVREEYVRQLQRYSPGDENDLIPHHNYRRSR